jgi:hypothetical protein
MRVGPGNAELRIAGFGACMITGYPHPSGGLFEIACRLIEAGLWRPVRSTIVSLGGFPAPRAQKYLRKALDFSPDYVALQFGSTDAQCPIRPGNRPTDYRPSPSTGQGLKPASDSSYHRQPATRFSPLRWKLASLIGYLRKIDPITPLPLYVAAIERMVKECRSAGATPVVLSPFVYGSQYTMRIAMAYTTALRDLAEVQDMILIDCMRVLEGLPKPLILQHDGFHLSQVGHHVFGQTIAESIVADAKKKQLQVLKTSVDEECRADPAGHQGRADRQ